MTLGKGVTGAGLKVNLESASPFFQLKSNIGFHFPRSEFCRMWNVAGIVHGKAIAQVAGATDLTLVRMTDAT